MIKSPAIFERSFEKERSNRKSISVVVRSLIEHLFPFNCYHGCIFYCYYFYLILTIALVLRKEDFKYENLYSTR